MTKYCAYEAWVVALNGMNTAEVGSRQGLGKVKAICNSAGFAIKADVKPGIFGIV